MAGCPALAAAADQHSSLKLVPLLAADANNVWSKAFAEMLDYLWVWQAYTREDIFLEASALYPDVAVVTAEDAFKRLLQE